MTEEAAPVQRLTVSLGTFVSIEAKAVEAGSGEREILDLACEAFDCVQSRMHATDPGSDLAAIAAAPVGSLLRVHPWTYQVLSLARRLWLASDRCFDPCLPEQPGRLGDLELVTPDRVRRRATVALDLGGIAKGFAVDRAIEALQAAGCSAGLVNAGGDLRVFGNEPHTVEVRVAGASLAHITLTNEALAVSEPPSLGSPREHRGFYSPLTGQYLAGRAVAVRAPTAAIADALTKCAIACPPETLQRLLAEHGARLLDLSELSRQHAGPCLDPTLIP